MDTELSMEFELEIEGAPAEREEDLKELLEEEEDFANNGGQPAFPLELGPLTYMNENLPREEDWKQLLQEEDPLGIDPLTYLNENLPCEEGLKELLEEEAESGINGGQPAPPLRFGPPLYMNENLPRDPGHIPEIDGWCKHRRRDPRQRRDQGWFLGGHFGGGEGRRTTIHWEPKEVDDLIAGVETFGRSQWTKIKENYFSDSDRTRGDLKDKWKNLRRVCTGNAQGRRDQPPDDDQIERIRTILND